MIVAGAGMVGLLSPSPVDADEHSATRSFSTATVDTGGEVVVTIEVADYGSFGQVVETLPAGFDYVSSSLSAESIEDEGQVIRFSLFGDDSFTYNVTASDTTGDYVFRGTALDFDRDSRAVGGQSDITVEAGAVTPGPGPSPTQPPVTEGLRATRSLPDAAVDAGSEFEVMVEAVDYGSFGQVVETLPAGFGYVSSSLSDESVEVTGQRVIFSLFDDGSFTYTVTASGTAGSYTFSGVVMNEDRESADVGGDSGVTVEAVAPTHSATRSFSDSTVEPGDEVVVTIAAAGYGGFGQVVETLPGGFGYVSSSLSGESVEVTGQRIIFSLFDDESFTYTVTASSVEADHTFSGVVMNEDRESADVGGDSTVTVAVPVPPTPVTPTASPTAAPSPTTGVSVTTARVPTLTVGGSSSRVNLPSIFSDMETDGLTYTAISSRSSVVKARVSGIILRLTPGGAGTSRITVTATDADGNETRRTFTVRVRAAELPPVGDLTAPDWLLALLALAGAALLPAGILTLRSRRRRAVP